MSKIAIKTENLGKMYKLYKSQKDKIMDVFGLNVFKKNYYQEFWALRNIDVQVRKGERIGIVGRNGAGKSTLLKTIIGNITPTEGNVIINGKVQALMELGTGFHPEFTGIENIRASLAYQGLTRKEIAYKESEIIDFAELDEFINQPIKTYSAGMYARLAFSTATAIEPDILIIDEVLGAGDAYFAGKCIDRMKKITKECGATVLFVSHDMSSVEMLCDRAIWIDRGKIIGDDSTAVISKGYAQMVRERTEKRLNLRNTVLSNNTNTKRSHSIVKDNVLQFILRFLNNDNCIIRINSVSLHLNNKLFYNINVGEPQDTSVEYDGFVLIDHVFSEWGSPSSDNNIYYRSSAISKNKSSAVVFNLDGIVSSDKAAFSIKWLSQGSPNASIQFFDGNIYRQVGSIDLENSVETVDGWRETYIEISHELLANFLVANGIIVENEKLTCVKDIVEQVSCTNELECNRSILGEIYTGDIKIDGVRFLNEEGKVSSIFKSFESVKIEIDYHVIKGPLKVEFVVCVHRLGVIALQSISGLDIGNLEFSDGKKGTAILEIPSLQLGKGTYLISIGIFPPLNYKSLDTEKTAYVLQDRRYEIQVEQPEDIDIDLGMCRGLMHWDIKT